MEHNMAIFIRKEYSPRSVTIFDDANIGMRLISKKEKKGFFQVRFHGNFFQFFTLKSPLHH